MYYLHHADGKQIKEKRRIYVFCRNIAGVAPLVNWWSGADYQIAFSRGDKAFIALNLEGSDLNANLQTGLPQGTYCDVISGNLENGRCTGNEVHVGGDGRAHISVCHSCEDPMVAIHVGECLETTRSLVFTVDLDYLYFRLFSTVDLLVRSRN